MTCRLRAAGFSTWVTNLQQKSNQACACTGPGSAGGVCGALSDRTYLRPRELRCYLVCETPERATESRLLADIDTLERIATGTTTRCRYRRRPASFTDAVCGPRSTSRPATSTRRTCRASGLRSVDGVEASDIYDALCAIESGPIRRHGSLAGHRDYLVIARTTAEVRDGIASTRPIAGTRRGRR